MGQQFSVTLSDDLAEMVLAKIRSGEFRTIDEVIGAALSQSDDTSHSGEEVERWLRTDVVETMERMKADPSRGRTPEQVRMALQEEYHRITASDR